MKKVMAFGTFDIFHAGHKSYLEQAKELGEYLIVVVARDETVLLIRKQRSVNSEQERRRIIKESKIANEVVLGNLDDKYAVIEKYRPDVIAIGYDQLVDLAELTEKLGNLKLKAEIVRLKSYEPERFKSSKLRK
ncbi:MAG: FAD synthase [Candidatus Moranbacteria bacterium]|nr:FAD synthase [Candidatus Moranbacteria bacterium]